MENTTNKDRVCQSLCGLLEHGEEVHRTVAAQALGHMGYTEATPNLIASLLDEDSDVRTDAAAALNELKAPQAADQLMQNLLGDPCPEVKLAALDILILLRHKDLEPWLVRLLKGRDEEIIWDEEEFFESGWDDWVDIQIRAIKGIAAFGLESAVPDIIEALDDEYAQDIADVAFAAFARLGNTGTEALISYAGNKDMRIRRRAVATLGTLKSVAASKAMSKAIQDEAADVRAAAGRAIAARDPNDKRLELLLVDKVPAVRALFASTCGRNHPERLAALLFEQFADVQSAVLKELIADPGIINEMGLKGRLLEILDSSETGPAALAAQALMKLSPEDMEAGLVEKLSDQNGNVDIRLGIVKALAGVSTDTALVALTSALSDNERQIRLDAMTAIAGRTSSAAWPNDAGTVLLAALRGEVVLAPEVEEEADEEATEAEAEEDDVVEETASQPDDDEEELVISESIDSGQPMQFTKQDKEKAKAVLDETMSDMGDEYEGLEIAEPDVEEPDFPQSTLAAVMGAESPSVDATLSGDDLVELTEEDLEFLELTGRSPRKKVVSIDTEYAPHQDVRRFAARVLGDVANEDVALELSECLASNDKELLITALDSLSHVGAVIGNYPLPVGEALIEKAKDGDESIRLGVARALAYGGSDVTKDLLKRYLRDHSSFVRTEAIRSLALCGLVDEAVEKCLTDKIPSVRLAAAEALVTDAGPDRIRRLVDFSFEFEGYHARPVAKLLRTVGGDAARYQFLEVMQDPERRRYWGVAISALEEMGRPEQSDVLAA